MSRRWFLRTVALTAALAAALVVGAVTGSRVADLVALALLIAVMLFGFYPLGSRYADIRHDLKLRVWRRLLGRS